MYSDKAPFNQIIKSEVRESRCATMLHEDEGRSLEVGLQEQASNRLTLLGIERSQVVSG
jgi:hypothetical protein